MTHEALPMRPALQARSRRTLDALLDALDGLLRDRSFDSIGVAELSRAAGVSTGAFYARFRSKDDLLPSLHDRYLRWLDALCDSELDPSSWTPLGLDARVERAISFICASYEARPWLLRAMVIHSRKRPPEAATPSTASPQARLLRRLVDLLAPGTAGSRSPARKDLEFAVYSAMTLAREVILFPHLPMARSLELTADTLRPRLRRLLGDTMRRTLAGDTEAPSS
jgi:AcrR family transcriptional regulator